jgi:hypothetical protein
MPDCPTCGTPVSTEARFCAECGRALPGRAGLLDEPLASRPSPRAWPREPFALLAGLLVAGGVVLAVAARWAWAAAAFLAAAVLVLVRARLGAGRGRWVVAGVRARAAATREAMAARSREQVELFRARRELAELEAERSRLYRDLGYAVYVADEAGIASARAAIDAVGERVARKESEIDAMRRATEERIQRAQAEVRPTVRMETPPEPVRVPEPWPPPDEGDVPDPAPTPTPGPETPEPQHPPAPQTGERAAG